jgi:hypothetical protein
MKRTDSQYHRHDLLVKRKSLLNDNIVLQKKLDENTKDIEAIDRVFKMLPQNETLTLFNKGQRTNSEIAENVLKDNGGKMKIKGLHKAFLEQGGTAQRPSFDTQLGKWIKDPKKKIERVGMGLYRYTG